LGLLVPGVLFWTMDKAPEPETDSMEVSIEPTESIGEPTESIGEPTDAVKLLSVLMPNGTVEQMKLEDYIVCVLLAEMPSEFEQEALKAQAVAARTYTLKRQQAGNKHENAAVCTDASCCQEFGTTPLHLAARRCMAETVSRMLADGADPNALGTACYGAGKEITPLMEALECSSTMMVLLENGADITPYKDTILWMAADRSPRVIRKLLELGANPEARGADGTSVLDLVIREGNEEKIRLIREALQHSRRKRR